MTREILDLIIASKLLFKIVYNKKRRLYSNPKWCVITDYYSSEKMALIDKS